MRHTLVDEALIDRDRGVNAPTWLAGALVALLVGACTPMSAPEGVTALPAVPRLTVTDATATRAVLDVSAVPGLSDAGRQSYARFLTFPAPRAFAIGADGGLAWAANARNVAEAEGRALAQCRHANGGRPCKLYARDQHVVWEGEAMSDHPFPGVSGEGWALMSPAGFLRHGRAAEGAILWTHGRGSDPRRQADPERSPMPLPFVQRFNNAGWDVWVLARDPVHDVNYDTVLSFADTTLRIAATALREGGYGRVVAAGQSAGGWAALAALDTPGLLDGAIAIAGAGLYQPPPGQNGTLDFPALLARVRDRTAPVVVAAFDGDHLLPWPERSAAMLRGRLADRPAPLLVINRPAGLAGHGAGAEPAFNDRYGDCILRAVATRDAAGC
ncbi:hypothetical protein [Elioraea sp.]|uniref:hypothetical protein n=1 Tax=Elioraea sp. TaxID=2185103 RepID=UPI0025C32507|nr:hypothetical protein [Elioraea sp.]